MAKNTKKMTLWEHLEDLRIRLLFAIIGLVVGIVISLFLSDYALSLLAQPIGGFEELQSIEVTENVGVFMRVTLLGGFIIALPHILIQVLLFILPALEKKEKRWLFIGVPLATLLFLGGAVFAYLVMLPAAIPLLIQFKGPEVLPRWKDYVDFVTNLVFWIGLSFETPLLMFILAKIGVVNAKQLARGWQIAVVVISVISAVITPTVDPINMLLFMIPLFLLYLLSILLAALAHR
ncbi:MAG: twin-arginine translocase subunit TatC [Chloroflexota bacterium]|jgi:sec-independent protein translocase protein TatC|nr:twin-arginine translocase subunit TatC [Chloroflexota bacterium]